MKKNYIYSKQLLILFLLFSKSIFSQSPCSGVPSPNSVMGPTATICPGVITLSLANTYSTSGITYQWQMSTTSNVGPFAAIPGATLSSCLALATNSLTYYNAVITCTNGNNAFTASVLQVFVAPGTTTNSVPYFESFEGINTNDQLPNCSWTASNLGNGCYTMVNGLGFTGNNHASFSSCFAGTNQFYTNRIQLNAGVTYSASVWYSQPFNALPMWSDFSILLSPSQSTVGQIVVGSTSISPFIYNYTSLSNTFTVPNSGLYYASVRAVNPISTVCQGLSWDDLAITAPCSLSSNKPNITLTTTSTMVCSGANTPPISFTASGVNTNSWSVGGIGPVITFTSNIYTSGNITVTGYNTHSGCLNTASIYLSTKPSPTVLIFANKPTVCKGSMVNIMAGGAVNYTWSNGQQSSVISPSPLISTIYSVVGESNNGCKSNASQLITVDPLPVLTVSSTSPFNNICIGKIDTLTANGAVNYQWSIGQLLLQVNQIVVSPSATTTYSLTGTDVNGCSSQTNFVLQVNECTGLSHLSSTPFEASISPNPFHEQFLLKTGTLGLKTILVTDLSGRTILSFESIEEKIIINTRYFSQGIYYVKIKSEEKLTIFKTIKN
jgi:hypothetical protein